MSFDVYADLLSFFITIVGICAFFYALGKTSKKENR